MISEDEYNNMLENSYILQYKFSESALDDIARNGDGYGEGGPEPLKGDLTGCYSRKINKKDRLIYRTVGMDIFILQCRMHYSDHKKIFR